MTVLNPATVVQRKPKRRVIKNGNEMPVVALVQHDLGERAMIGIREYGDFLRVHNDRDHLVDAYQDALDLCCYLRAEIERRKR